MGDQRAVHVGQASDVPVELTEENGATQQYRTTQATLLSLRDEVVLLARHWRAHVRAPRALCGAGALSEVARGAG